MKKVYVEINGRVTMDGETDTMSSSTEGKLYKKSGKYYINYTEGQLLGGSECSTTIKVNPEGIVTMMRSGAANTQMIFEEGRSHMSCYETDCGNLNVNVTAGEVRIDMHDDGGSVDIDYNLSINNLPGTRNHVNVQVRP